MSIARLLPGGTVSPPDASYGLSIPVRSWAVPGDHADPIPSSAAPTPPTPPTDVPVGELVAARRGDSAAFARFVTHWNPAARQIVHLTLGGEGDTDRVLSATYLRAYRALPRYGGEPAPGPWLLRIAYLAATDELRRVTRDPRVREGARRRASDPEDEPITTGNPLGWRALDPDQRALVALVDRVGLDPATAALALDSPRAVVDARLDAARRALCLAQGASPEDLLADADLAAARTRATVAGIPVPPPDDDFWPLLGKRLLAEQESPAAPTPDPLDRLTRAHPARPGFRPVPIQGGIGSTAEPVISPVDQSTVADLADQADRLQPRRPVGPILLVIGLSIAVVAVLAAAITYGTGDDTVAGSIATPELGARMSAALHAEVPTEVEVQVTDATRRGGVDSRWRVTYASDGSWFTGARGAIEGIAHDAPGGESRRVAAELADGAEPTTVATVHTGLSSGSPDPTDQPPAFYHDLEVASTVLRSDTTGRAAPTSEDGVLTYTAQRTLPTGTGGVDEVWQIEVRRGDHRPVRIERRRGERLVRRTRFSAWRTVDEVPADRFRPAIPDGVEAVENDADFLATPIAAVTILGRGPAVTPEWLPAGFRLATTKVRRSGQVASLGFQRGPEHLTITTRAITSPTSWSDPFRRRAGDGEPQRRTLRSGHFNGATIHITVAADGTSRLWGTLDDPEFGPTGFTVAGEVTVDELRQITASLR